MTAQIHEPMPYEAYEQLPGLRSSELRRARVSMLHYRYGSDGGDTAARSMLRAIHARILEPDEFARRWAVYDGVRRGKLYDAWCACHPGVEAIKPREYNAIQRTAEAVSRHPVAGPIVSGDGRSEVTITWTHRASGLRCKARIDRWVPGGVRLSARGVSEMPAIVDLKGYGTPEPRRVGAKVWQLGAHLQAAHYLDAIEAATGKPHRYLLVVYELSRPHDVAVYEIPPDVLRMARPEREDLLDRIARSRKSNRWPGCVDGIEDLALPAYAYAGDEEVVVTDTDPNW